jgi:hypothetical protein
MLRSRGACLERRSVRVVEVRDLVVVLGGLDVGIGGGVEQHAPCARRQRLHEVGKPMAHDNRIRDVELALRRRREHRAPVGEHELESGAEHAARTGDQVGVRLGR